MTSRDRRDKHQPQVAPGKHGEGRIRVHLLPEAQVIAVEREGRVDVIDDIPDADGAHWLLLLISSSPHLLIDITPVSVPG